MNRYFNGIATPLISSKVIIFLDIDPHVLCIYHVCLSVCCGFQLHILYPKDNNNHLILPFNA